MEVPDRELLAWLTGEADVPADTTPPLFRRLRDFNRTGESARDKHARNPPPSCWRPAAR